MCASQALNQTREPLGSWRELFLRHLRRRPPYRRVYLKENCGCGFWLMVWTPQSCLENYFNRNSAELGLKDIEREWKEKRLLSLQISTACSQTDDYSVQTCENKEGWSKDVRKDPGRAKSPGGLSQDLIPNRGSPAGPEPAAFQNWLLSPPISCFWNWGVYRCHPVPVLLVYMGGLGQITHL